MRRFLYLLGFLYIPFSSLLAQEADSAWAMPVDENTEKITYQEVVKEEGTKTQLFNRAINWVNTFYNNPVAVTKIREIATGRIECRHQIRLTKKKEGVDLPAGLVLYSVILELKDGRYRYTVTDFVLRQATKYPIENWMDESDPAYNEQWGIFLKQVDVFSKELIENLKQKMRPVEVIKEEEW
jgi:uncharacterized protein with TBP-like fold DUF4468